MYALEHEPSVREKLFQLDASQRKELNSKLNKQTEKMTTHGIKFNRFNDIFQSKRSQLFLVILKLLSGV